MMFSRTVSSSTRPSVRRFSEQNAMSWAIAAVGLRMPDGAPSTSSWPWSARSAPNSSRASSVRPEPSSPASPTTSPAWMVRLNGAIAPLRPTSSAWSSGRSAAAGARLVCSSSCSRTSSSLPIIFSTSSSWGSSGVRYSPTSFPLRSTVIRSEIW
jgi:hypothetical protein